MIYLSSPGQYDRQMCDYLGEKVKADYQGMKQPMRLVPLGPK